MASKVQAQEEPMESILIEFEKAAFYEEVGGRVIVKLNGVRPLELIGMEAIERVLADNGLPEERVHTYTEQFFNLVQVGELAQMLAKRARRVG